jgi:hypothetical protein
MNYTQLQADIAGWLNRSDVSAVIPTWIRMAEQRMSRDPRLRVQDAVIREDLTVSSHFTTLPTAFRRMVNIERADGHPLEYRSPQEMDRLRAQQISGEIRYYSILGRELELLPVPSAAEDLEIVYYSAVPELTSLAPTNWLLSAAYDIYLYASLAESAPYFKEDERIQTWEAMYNARCDAYRDSSVVDEFSGSPLVINPQSIG